jgi:hypothetical protein
MDDEGLEEAPDVARNVLVALDPAVDKQGWGRKIPNTSGSRGVVVVTAGFRVVIASAGTTPSSRAGSSVIIRHIPSNSWEVNTSSGACSDEGLTIQVQAWCPGEHVGRRHGRGCAKS